MPQMNDHPEHAGPGNGLVEQAATLGGDPAEDAFVRTFFRDVPPGDIDRRPAATLSDMARSLWRFGAQRTPGTAAIRVAGGAIELVTDDMPFLVASIGGALAEMGEQADLVIHPIVPVRREGAARVDGPGAAEAMMRIELAGGIAPDRAPALCARIAGVLDDVRDVVDAWPGMRAEAASIATKLEDEPEAGAAEAAAFLRWLDDGNFVYLGTREYRMGADGATIVPGSGRGLLRHDGLQVFDGALASARAAPNVHAFLLGRQRLIVTKSSRVSPVYRNVPMDAAVIKSIGPDGGVTGLRLVLGLFTASSHLHPAQAIPVLRLKVARTLDRSGFAPASYNRQALQRILDGFPRDEMFQIDDDALFETALGIMHLKQRPRIRLFVLRDQFERSVTCLAYLPRDRYSAEIRRSFTALLEQAFNGGTVLDTTTFDEAGLACLHLVLTTRTGQVPDVNVGALERQLVEAARSWSERLHDTLAAAHGAPEAAAIVQGFGAAFPPAYMERTAAQEAMRDLGFVRAVAGGQPLALALSEAGAELLLKTFHRGGPLALSDILPMLENLGVRVIGEIPYEITPADGPTVWIQEFQMQPGANAAPAPASLRLFEDALSQVWSGAVENDGFNRLVLAAGLSARQVVVLRTYCKLLRQAGSSYSQAYMEDTLAAQPDLAGLLVALFEAQFDPAAAPDQVDQVQQRIATALEAVDNLDEDRILRGYLLLVGKTLRTNHYQPAADGSWKPYLSIKLASREIDLLPLPRPLVEIFVYSPRMEGCHLRGGKVARGGIRWSDRKEDFRTEVLGLMKAQMVKNAVIVPIGSKGGFVVKQPPAGGRDALLAEGVACYKLLMAGLLDVTDNFEGAAIVPPASVVSRDPPDPYLVVAADKGTATFSDIANAVAVERGFWLGDAFASGGSVGYDHKAMGITAKGAWEAVKRHFREIGTDIQTTDFTCVGVGDMAGDVFGNGMLLSRHTRLLAAFNHMHIFIDPDPDAATSWVERKRLFDLPRSSWADYDKALLSPGGAVYERRAKSIRLSPEARRRFAITGDSLSPAELIQVLLRHDTDLLWFGGIGTYVKASQEGQADAGDRANDSLRIDATALRAKVVGEGANLAITHRARIEYALRGGRINTDAIDNSAGVDTSDHEGNIKIGTGDLIAAGRIPPDGRHAFLAAMTDEVERLVLVDNVLQTQAVSLAQAQGAAALDRHVRLMRAMERSGQLDRKVEFLPDDDAILQRGATGRGLTRPEIAVLLAYAKNGLYERLLASDLPDQPELRPILLDYFPHAMRSLDPGVLATHRLRREIVATVVANALVNRMGPDFIEETATRTGRDAPAIARATLIVVEVFDLEAVWREIAALDNIVPAATLTELLLAVMTVMDQAVRWFLLSGLPLDIAVRQRQFAPGLRTLASAVAALQPESEQALNAQRRAAYLAQGAPPPLADRILVLNALSTAMDIVQVSEATGRDIVDVARLYFGSGVTLGLLTLRRQARTMPAATEWQRQVVDTLVDDSYAQQRELVRQLVDRPDADLVRWLEPRALAAANLQDVMADVARTTPPDLAMLTVASQRVRALVAAAGPG